jgi:hypothetical protein
MADIDANLDLVAGQMRLLVGFILAVALAPWLLRLAPLALRLCRWVAGLPILSYDVSAPLVAAWRAYQRWRDPAAESRRELGRYLRSLPPHSGLTAYEEMVADIAALPPGSARNALRLYLKKVAPPSRRQVWAARRQRGKPRVPRIVVDFLCRGKVPPVWVRGQGWRLAPSVKGVAA